MENLSALEMTLLLSIQTFPGKALEAHYPDMGATYAKVLHAANSLKNQGYVTSDGRCYWVDAERMQKENADISKEFATEAGTVHAATNVLPETVMKADMTRPTADSVMQLLTDANGRPRTSADMAAFFGCKGTALTWILRGLVAAKKAVKIDTEYFLYKEEDAVIHTQPIPETRRVLTSDGEVRAVIQNMKDAFTAESCHAEISRAFIVEKKYFLEVFGDLSMDGYFNVKQDGEYVNPVLDFDPDNLHSVRRIMSVDAMSDALDAYTRRIEPPFDLHHVIETLHLPHDKILDYFIRRGFNVGDVRLIAMRAVLNKTIENEVVRLQTAAVVAPKPVEKTPVKSAYTKLEDLDLDAVAEYLDGGVRLPIFIKHFGLDPLNTVNIRTTLVKAGIAEYVAVTNFLFPARKKVEEIVPVAEVDKPVVTHAAIKALEPTPRDPNKEIVIPRSTEQLAEDAIEKAEELLNELADAVCEEVDNAPKYEGIGIPVELQGDNGKRLMHVTQKDSPYYGHRVLQYREGERLCAVSTEPDVEWIAAQTKLNAKDVITLTAPTGQPPRQWSEQEKESLVAALREVHADESVVRDLQGSSIGVKGKCGPGPHPTGEPLIEMERQRQRQDDAELEAFAEVLEPHLNKIIESCRMPTTPAPTVNKPKAAWNLTLEMLEQRLTFEHQTSAAKNLREIREYLEAL